MKNILFIHQSADLYGSDKTLLLLVSDIRNYKLNPIVVLPGKGLLYDELIKAKITVHILPVMKISRSMFSAKSIIGSFRKPSAIKALHQALQGTPIDIVYSNTLAVLLGYFYAKRYNKPHIWHVHEIIESPKVGTKIFARLLKSKVNNAVIYNSYTTQSFWQLQSNRIIPSYVVWNGIKPSELKYGLSEINAFRASYGFMPDDIVIALVGRINRWKGHELLLHAFQKLTAYSENVKLLFAGSPPSGQEYYQEELLHKIESAGLSKKVTLLPFQTNIWPVWYAIDIAVVPSIEPEPFGLVAVEAMMTKKPLIVSMLGGVKEIVEHEVSGYIFDPRKKNDLEQYLLLLIKDKTLRLQMGENGFRRAMDHFLIDKYVKSIADICIEL